MNIKLNLIIDGNYILYRNVFSLHKLKTLYGDLERSLEHVITSHLRKYPFENIYLVADSRSINWRKKIYPEYKSQRKKDEGIDWEFCFNTYDQFKNNLKENNKRVKIFEEDGFEGDDFIYFLSKYRNSKGESNLIIASDGDLSQILDYRIQSNSWINMQMKDDSLSPKLYLPQGYKLFFKEAKSNTGDILEANENQMFLSYMKELATKCKIEEVDSEMKLFIKIIKGDTGDNIKSVLTTEQKSGRVIGIGDSGALKIWEKYKLHYPMPIDFKSSEWIDSIIPYITEYKKVEMNTNIAKEVKDKIEFNRRLVHLHPSNYPNVILEKAKNLIK